MTEISECKVAHLRPTQITVGLIEVHDKRKHLRAMSHDERHDYLRAHPIPVVIGPEDRLYPTDHHHLGRALCDEDIEHAYFIVEADFSRHALDDFWSLMDEKQWVHPVDENGCRHGFGRLPKHLTQLIDDPYRSLAGYVRNAGGYAKTSAAFAEFTWADFFRRRVRIGEGHDGFDAAVAEGRRLALSVEAAGLPGYLGPASAGAR